MKYIQKTLKNFRSKFLDGKEKIETEQVESKKQIFVSVRKTKIFYCKVCNKKHSNFFLFANDKKGIESDCFNDNMTLKIANELKLNSKLEIVMNQIKTTEKNKKIGLRVFSNHTTNKYLESILNKMIIDNKEIVKID